MSEFSSRAKLPLEEIVFTAGAGAKEIQELREILRAAVKRRETDYGHLLDLYLDVDHLLEVSAGRFVQIQGHVAEADRHIGPANKKRP